MFWNKKINLTAYTDNAAYLKNSPPTFNVAQMPDYLKNLKAKKIRDEQSGIDVPSTSIKTCPGIREFLSSGIQICAWEDTIIRIHPEGHFTFAIPQAARSRGVASHHHDQWGDLYPKGRVSVKLISPWMIKADQPARFLMMESHYSTSLYRDFNAWVPPGIVDFHQQRSTNIHIIFPVNDVPYDVFIKCGQPLVTLFPLTDTPINFNTQLATTDEFGNLSDLPYTFLSRYYRFKNND